MNMFKKISPHQVVIAAAVVFIIFMLCKRPTLPFQRKSTYSIHESMYAPTGDSMGPSMGPSVSDAPQSQCEMKAGTGLASSLLPREVASQEDFGEFAPEDILAGQNFLDPRSQIGFPESIGGALRNANQQLRTEPPNPKEPYMWNNSTIVPDLMKRSFDM
jgi:hypothetical protein